MLRPDRILWTATLSAALIAPSTGLAQQPNSSTSTRTSSGILINSHQIDRYEAIRQLQDSLRSDPNNLADWVILGELAQEVAGEVPADQSRSYYRTAREAYDNALKIRPDDRALRAAAQFARDQEQDVDRFNQHRNGLTSSYLDARRRELNEQGPNPTVRVYPAPPSTNVATQPSQANQPANRQAYHYPTYQPYTTPEGEPYTYQQYSRGYFPPNAQPGANAQPGRANVPGQQLQQQRQQPMTLRQYSQQLPNVLLNEATQRITGGTVPGATNPGAVNPAAAASPPTTAPRPR